MSEYQSLLEDEIFKAGKYKGQLKTALTILTDMMIELNALEVFYQKPTLKLVSPQEIRTLRSKMEAVKLLIHDSIDVEH